MAQVAQMMQNMQQNQDNEATVKDEETKEK